MLKKSHNGGLFLWGLFEIFESWRYGRFYPFEDSLEYKRDDIVLLNVFLRSYGIDIRNNWVELSKDKSREDDVDDYGSVVSYSLYCKCQWEKSEDGEYLLWESSPEFWGFYFVLVERPLSSNSREEVYSHENSENCKGFYRYIDILKEWEEESEESYLRQCVYFLFCIHFIYRKMFEQLPTDLSLEYSVR